MGFLGGVRDKGGAGTRYQGGQVEAKKPEPSAPAAETKWVKTGAASGPREGGELSGGELSAVLGTQVSSLSARWALRPRREGETQKDWEATVNAWAESRKVAKADTPEVDRLAATIESSVARLSALRGDPTNPEVATLYQGLGDAATALAKNYDVPASVKTRVLESMLPALDRGLVHELSAGRQSALSTLPQDYLFKQLGAPIYEALAEAKSPALGSAFMGAASSVAVMRDGEARKQQAERGLGSAVIRLYPEVKHETAPEVRMPEVGNSEVLMHLMGPQIARATFFRGAVPDVLSRGEYRAGGDAIDFRAQLRQVGRGGDQAQAALAVIQQFITAHPPGR